jgi:hypothetical protein
MPSVPSKKKNNSSPKKNQKNILSRPPMPSVSLKKIKNKLVLACPQRDSHALGALHFFCSSFFLFFPSILLIFRAKKDAIGADFLYGFFPFFFLQALL